MGSSLVDWEEDGVKRAYAMMYRAEQILNWRTERMNEVNVVTLVVLHETVETGGDEFETETVEQVRV